MTLLYAIVAAARLVLACAALLILAGCVYAIPAVMLGVAIMPRETVCTDNLHCKTTLALPTLAQPEGTP